MTKFFDNKKHVNIKLMPTQFPAVSQHSPKEGSFSTFNSWENFTELKKEPNFNENMYVNFKITHNCV